MSFKQLSHLQQHKRLHEGIRPYKCSQCGQSFTQVNQLNSHKLVHSGEKPFECSKCTLRYSSTTHLQEHKRKHSGEKYDCEVCLKQFQLKRSLRLHIKKGCRIK